MARDNLNDFFENSRRGVIVVNEKKSRKSIFFGLLSTWNERFVVQKLARHISNHSIYFTVKF